MSQANNEILVKSGDLSLPGNLTLAGEEAAGIVVFAHGSGSSRLSPRNQRVARYLNDAGFSTLLFDLLTAEEDKIDRSSRAYRFDIPRLGQRLEGAAEWVAGEFPDMKLGLFGASTGAAAALITAAERPQLIHAVVSRGGRPDLAGNALERVKAPVLLIVGGLDLQVIELNQHAAERINAPNELVIIPGATHLFEEPGKLLDVCRFAAYWFKRHLAAGPLEVK